MSVSTLGIFNRIVMKVYSRHLYVWNLGEVHRNLGANKIRDTFLVLKLLFDVHLQSKEVYPNIIEDTEVNIKALVEAVILTEQVQAKVGIASRHHHRCRRRHRRLVVQHSCFPCFLGGINCWSKTNICNSTLFRIYADHMYTCKAKRVSSLSSSINQIAGQTLQEYYFTV